MRFPRPLVPLVLAALVASCRESAAPPPRPPTPAPSAASSAPPPAPPAPAAAAGAPALPPPRSEREAAARAAVQELRSRLQAALQEALTTKGPEEAIAACRDQAPRIAAEIGAGPRGIRVGRTSHRLRNPGNAPEEWVATLLPGYVDGRITDPSMTVALPDGSLGYLEPIKTGALCLTCHGSAVAEPLGAKLASLYPQDQATGFAEGDLRGLFWAVVPPE